MTNSDTKYVKIEEELKSFWPQWHVDRYLGGDIFGDVFRIYRSDSGLKMVSVLKAIKINDYSMAGPEQMQPCSRIAFTDEPGGRTEISEVLADEIQTMELLRGAPNIVEIQDYYYKKKPGTSFLFIRTEDLTSFQDIPGEEQQENGSISADEIKTLYSVLKIGLDICSALMYCEQKGIIHRNIRPANLFVDPSGNYKIGDFVSSKRLKSVQLDLTMTRAGTISHVAPEIYTWSSCDNTVDIYALGLVLYQLLNGGRMPFLPPEGRYSEADIDSANFQRLHGVPVPPLAEQILREAAKNGTAISRTNAERLDKIIRKACESDPPKRFQSAWEFYEALNGYGRGLGVKDLQDASEKPQEQQIDTSPSLQDLHKEERRTQREEILQSWKAVEKTEGKTEEKAPEKAAEKTEEQTIEKAAEKTEEQIIEKAAEKTEEQIIEKAPEKAAEKTEEQTIEKAAEKTEEQIIEKAPEKTEEQTIEKAEGKTEEQAIEKAAEKTEEKIIEKAAEKPAEKAAGKAGTAKKKKKNSGVKWLAIFLIIGFIFISQDRERSSTSNGWENRAVPEESPVSNEPWSVSGNEKEWTWDNKDNKHVEITDSWEEIISAGRDGTYADKYQIGDTKELDLGSEGIITMRLVAMDADELADGSGRAPMTWIAGEYLNTRYYMNPEDTNAGGWESSDMRSWLRESVFPLMPSELQEGIREVTKYSCSYEEKDDVATKDTIWIPSVREIFYSEYSDEIDDLYEKRGVDYSEAFPDSMSREIDYSDASDDDFWWWLRSADDSNTEDFTIADSLGFGYISFYATEKDGVVIGFCL